jgi:hypothetical protein
MTTTGHIHSSHGELHMSRHHDDDIRDLLQRLTDQNEDILARISALERQRDRFGPDEVYAERDEFDDEADRFARSDPSQKFGQPPYEYSDTGPVITDRGLPRSSDHPAFSRYRKATDSGLTFGSDLASYAESQQIGGANPTDRGLEAVARFRRHQSRSRT